MSAEEETQAEDEASRAAARERLPRDVARGLALATLGTIVAVVLRPWLKDLWTFGFHDWDSQTAHRYLVRASLLRYHQFPGWNPYACGGFTAWGYVEGDTNVVSPFLPFYLILPMALALRVEVFGMAAIGAFGAYLLAGRFTKSHAARALVAALWAVDGRWGLQTASGHTWHLAYAYVPWCFYFFERARGLERRTSDLALGGGAFAMLVYAGGIYPLPHAALSLGLYAVLLAAFEKSLRPLTTLAALGALSIGLAAPKLFPVIEGFGKVPRLIESTETLDLGALWAALTSRDQAFYSRPARVVAYGWHEWGLYISFSGVMILVVGFLAVRGRRETALKVVALVFLVLGFGAFHPEAPWTLLHKYVPVFRSQHVPSRFLYTSVLLSATVAAAGFGRLVERASTKFPWADAVACVLVLALGVDVALVASKPMADAMWMVPPDHIDEKPFHFEREPPIPYKRRDWAGPMYLAMLANTGVLNCYGTPPFDRKGARVTGEPGYLGEARIEGGKGTAKISAWSPNAVTIDVEGAEPGARLVWNMNFDEGFHADAGRVEAFQNAVSVKLERGSGSVRIAYTPPYLWLGVLVLAGTAALLARAVRRERAARLA